MKILITGGNGQLGNSVKMISAEFPGHTYLFTDIDDLDITSRDDLDTYFEKFKPDFCINCAGYTGVDKAEEEEEKAYLLNAEAVKLLNGVTGKYNCRFIHISTDYVFSGKHYEPYKESHEPDANSVYGKSKLAGEKEISGSEHAVILRTSWLYSEFGGNFFKTMLGLMEKRDELKVVFDQVGTPTYAADLARAVLKIISAAEKGDFVPGIYHFSNEGVASWYDFSKEIGHLSGSSCKIFPVETSQFSLPAPRPPFSVLNKSRIKEVYKTNIPHWRDSLETCYKNFINQKQSL